MSRELQDHRWVTEVLQFTCALRRQINGSHGAAEATFNPTGNAKAAAIAISDDGRDWYPWTTYVTGAYEGRC